MCVRGRAPWAFVRVLKAVSSTVANEWHELQNQNFVIVSSLWCSMKMFVRDVVGRQSMCVYAFDGMCIHVVIIPLFFNYRSGYRSLSIHMFCTPSL
jgi:hypothetical protein